MSQENAPLARRSVSGSVRGRVAALGAALVALACLLCVVLPVHASAGTAFRQVTVRGDAQLVRSDGVRFVTLGVRLQGDSSNAPWVFDTLARRRFRPAPPSPDCWFFDVGGGFALWHCPSLTRPLISDLATGGTREPVGWAAVEAMERRPPYTCSVYLIGRYWLEGDCGFGIGPRSNPFFLNHRTGRLIDPSLGSTRTEPERINLDYRELVTPRCAPVRRSWLHISVPPFTLQALRWRGDDYGEFEYGEIRLRRCGERRADIVSRCGPSNNCAAVQLGSRYVTWAEGNRVFAYLPRARRRVLVAPAPARARIWERPVTVVHTCDRVFAQWPDGLFVAPFKPRRGAPPCQAHKQSDTARASLEAARLRD